MDVPDANFPCGDRVSTGKSFAILVRDIEAVPSSAPTQMMPFALAPIHISLPTRWRSGILPLLLGGILGCQQAAVAPPEPTPIAALSAIASPPVEIETETETETETPTEVYLVGEVKESVAFIESGAYLLQDESGEIWIYTDNALPAVGARIAVVGEVEYQSIPIDARNWGEMYVREREQSLQQP